MQRIRVLLFLGLSFVLFNPSFAGAFGVSPPSLSSDRLVHGSRWEGVVFLTQGDPQEPLDVKVTIKADEKIKSWITLDQGEQFTIPAGVKQFPVKVMVRIPDDADFGVYSGSISFATFPKRQEGQQILVSVGAGVSFGFTVGEGVVADFVIKRIDILDIREGQAPKVSLIIENTGNVPVAPDRVTFELFDKYGQVRLGYGEAEGIPTVPPFREKTVVAKVPVGLALGVGSYTGNVKVYRGDAEVGQLRTSFDVTKRVLNFYLIGGLAAGAAILLGGSWFWKLRGRKRLV